MTVIETTPVLNDTDLGEPSVAHIIQKRDGFRGYVEGKKIRALCGEEFIPTRDPERYPICTACLARKEQLDQGLAGNN